ncbi:hypothetical protein DQ04_00401170 [Trypanosoma grayi]|uniref:hypothetical protein n=1 Tax=Trypanosoma grayi TaxID=71804 RepID=UPI0004F46678|nr:hypothetical protein DQ04_00401170 [Trypanosoma grayi]KEG14577.1 hypothetical protein DQ04_00401170 [Trypanosoma grayi]
MCPVVALGAAVLGDLMCPVVALGAAVLGDLMCPVVALGAAVLGDLVRPVVALGAAVLGDLVCPAGAAMLVGVASLAYPERVLLMDVLLWPTSELTGSLWDGCVAATTGAGFVDTRLVGAVAVRELRLAAMSLLGARAAALLLAAGILVCGTEDDCRIGDDGIVCFVAALARFFGAPRVD